MFSERFSWLFVVTLIAVTSVRGLSAAQMFKSCSNTVAHLQIEEWRECDKVSDTKEIVPELPCQIGFNKALKFSYLLTFIRHESPWLTVFMPPPETGLN